MRTTRRRVDDFELVVVVRYDAGRGSCRRGRCRRGVLLAWHTVANLFSFSRGDYVDV